MTGSSESSRIVLRDILRAGWRASARFVAPSLLALLLLVAYAGGVKAQTFTQIDIPGPSGSGEFGWLSGILQNGNFFVSDPFYNAPGAVNAGAVYLYDGATLELISQLTGSSANDGVGLEVIVLANGNFVVVSPAWDNGAATDAGAVTWVSGTTGISGVVSEQNSLVGSTPGDIVGSTGVTALANGNFVVVSPAWNNGAVSDAGAVTWGSGTTGISGVVSELNSLVGSTTRDFVGNLGVTALANGNYVVMSPDWNNGAVSDVGAVTWGSGTIGISGVVSEQNSLVGGMAGDSVGSGRATALANGNYVVSSPLAAIAGTFSGAATWGNGATGSTGTVSAANSLTGGAVDLVSSDGIVALSNGNYVVRSSNWDNPTTSAFDAGAVTWGNGATGSTGTVSADNSLVGTTQDDVVGSGEVRALANGNYVVASPHWSNGGASKAGAVTWGNGATGTTGPVALGNSLVGTSADDNVGETLTALTNGNYVVSSPHWDNGSVVDAGAATWVNGSASVSAIVTVTNSLAGSTTDDRVGMSGAIALTNGNYVVASPYWDNGGVIDAGAATWGSGVSGIKGLITVGNSLVGGMPHDVAGTSITAINNGNYVVLSLLWDNGSTPDVGAVTWANGATGLIGVVSTANSLFGSTADDQVGSDFVQATGNDGFRVRSIHFDGTAVDSGAVTLVRGQGDATGLVSPANSVLGTAAGYGSTLHSTFNPVRGWVAVGRPVDNIVTIAGFGFPFSVGKTGTGTGTVSSTIAGIDCGSTCAAQFWDNSVVTLTATHDPSSTFTGWSGDCSGVGACAVTMTQARNVTATFTRKTYALTVNKTGTGTGTVSGAPANPIAHGTVVTLTATADAGSVFSGWSGDCSGTGACVVTMTQARNVTATFGLNTVDPNTHVLTINKTGTGTGTVSGAPSNPIAHGTVVTLSATANAGSVFSGWSGDCSGAGQCILTMDAAKTVTATFTLQPPDVDEVEVDISPAGRGGTVTVEVITDTVAVGAALMPVRVAATEETYPVGTVLRLTALPYLGYAFEGWGGHLSGTLNPLDVVVTQPLVVTAAFVVADVFLPAVGK